MARLVLLKSAKDARPNTLLGAHRASSSEGEAARRLLDEQGYPARRTQNGQSEHRCPFHEGPGQIEPRKSTNFYVNATTGLYACHSASCGERGNLQTLERFFGVGQDEAFLTSFESREERLRGYERALTQALRGPFYAAGLTDQTIERFRVGYDQERQRYVIPYLDGRRPRFFRYYQPDGDPRWKYTWEEGAEATLYNAQDAIGDKDGRVLVLEGEKKVMLAVQLGYAAVGVPGASQWKPEWQAAFTHARQVVFVYDNDNPDFHRYDRPERRCPKCAGDGLDACRGHNPGQDAALARVEQVGWRARNVVLPLPGPGAPKTDLNEYLMRDGHNAADLAELITGRRATPFRVQSLAEITQSPPDEVAFLVDEGILPRSGRLLVAGRPKAGKSILVDNLALSLAAGIPFLRRFRVDHPSRVLLLDRELSKWSLFRRLHALMDDRPGYRAAMDNLLVDHDHLLRLDQKGAYETMVGLVEQNGAEVVVLDTAYKFFGGSVEDSSNLARAFEVLDRVIHETGCSFVLTHHNRKSGQARSSRENTDVPDPQSVVGSFLWTGWPNATILLNFLNRSVEDPFNAICTFAAFRDAAPPDPLVLYRTKDSIAYSAIEPYRPDEQQGSPWVPATSTKPSTEAVAEMLLDACPTTEDDFLHVAAARFGVAIATVRPYYLDALSGGHFTKTNGRPPVIKYAHTEDLESWESEHGLPERPVPSGFVDVDMFAAQT